MKLFEVHTDKTEPGKRAACGVNPRQVMTYATDVILLRKGTRGVVI